jgi:hypothetical protein
MNKRKEKKITKGLQRVINDKGPTKVKPGTYINFPNSTSANIAAGTVTSSSITTGQYPTQYPTTPNVYPFPGTATTAGGNATYLPSMITHEEVGALAKELGLEEDINGTLVDVDGKRYSIVDAMVKLLALVKALKPTYRECSDCGQENPHQVFDYICIKCRDAITKASMDE